MRALGYFATLFAFIAATFDAQASLRYSNGETDDGTRYMIVEGSFEFSDNLDLFVSAVRANNPSMIGFNSQGGNVTKAMELGRLIRSHRLNTLQPRGMECASACSLAFIGGIVRWAEPGAIGVHKSSFSDQLPLTTSEAVSAVQQLTAEVMSYMMEMGVDPALLHLSLQYESNDIRYLSGSEMAQYRVTSVTSDAPAVPQAPAPTVTPPQTASVSPAPVTQSLLAIPEPRSGKVRHPKGRAPMKALPDGKSASLTNLRNGTPVAIEGSIDRWYQVRAPGLAGYMHHSWVYVDQFESGPFNQRHVQIKSFDNLREAEAFVRASPLTLSAYLATNQWFAITLTDTYLPATAETVVRMLKEQKAVPDDAFVVYGNTYVRKVCCN